VATILFAWELGGGLGHLTRLAPLAKNACKRGHRVFAALRDLSQAKKVFGGIRIRYLQAPLRIQAAGDRIDPPRTFSHILHNIGFGRAEELEAMAEAWRNLYDFVKPDLIVFDHSPTALLAARGCRASRAVIGTGFEWPPDVYPLPNLRPWLGDAEEALRQDEEKVLSNANRVLDIWGKAPLERLSQLYHQVELGFLTTFRELDHYPDRRGAEYWVPWADLGGKTPVWPARRGKRIYAYLKPFPALPALLTTLNKLRCPTIVYVDGIDTKLQQCFRSATLHFENEPLDLRQVGTTCDLAILNGNHGTTVSMLLAGKPMLHVPIYLEQALTGEAVMRIGAGLATPSTKPDRIEAALIALLYSQKYSESARCFSANYSGFRAERQIEKVAQRVEDILN